MNARMFRSAFTVPHTLTRHLTTECLKSGALSLGVLLGVVMALFMAELLGDVARGRVPGGTVLELLALRLPEAVMLVGPLALLTGLLLALGQLGQDRELVIMRASGMGPGRLLAVMLAVALGWASAMLAVSGWLAPMAAERTDALVARADEDVLMAGIRPGHFQQVGPSGMTVYAGAVDEDSRELSRIFVHHEGPEGPELMTARRGRIWVDPADGVRYLSLDDGQHLRHARNGRGWPMSRVDFARNDLRLPPPQGSSGRRPLERMRLPELAVAERDGVLREWHWRIAPVIASGVLAFLAVPLALGQPRGGRFASVIVALLVYLAYSHAVHLGLIWLGRNEDLAAGIWPVHIAVAGIAAFMWVRLARQW